MRRGEAPLVPDLGEVDGRRSGPEQGGGGGKVGGVDGVRARGHAEPGAWIAHPFANLGREPQRLRRPLLGEAIDLVEEGSGDPLARQVAPRGEAVRHVPHRGDTGQAKRSRPGGHSLLDGPLDSPAPGPLRDQRLDPGDEPDPAWDLAGQVGEFEVEVRVHHRRQDHGVEHLGGTVPCLDVSARAEPDDPVAVEQHRAVGEGSGARSGKHPGRCDDAFGHYTACPMSW